MKKSLSNKRTILALTACLLLTILVFSLSAAGADGTRMIYTRDAGYPENETPTPDKELAERFYDIFGMDAEVEVGEDNRPVSVNGFPYRTVEAGFNIRSVEDKYITETDWVDYPFWRPATQYNGSLANMSLIMAMCSARDIIRNENPETFDPARDVEAYLLNAGFSDIRKDDYSKETSLYTISTAIGSRRMEHEGEEPFTLLAVGVCGGGYKNEWQSNITIGNGAIHEGFRSASDLVIDRIAGYITTRGIGGRIKIWISGFSRAAAVANLTAGRLTRAGAFPKEDVFAYTFATPAAVLNPPETGDENIFNILCPTDLVPQTAPAEWGYGRYGQDLWIPVKEFSSIGETVTQEREKTTREKFGIDIHYSASLNLRMRMLFSMLLEEVKDRDHFARDIQKNIVEIMQKKNASNLLITLRNMLLSVKDGESRASLDHFLDFVIRVFGNAITRTELAAVNRNSGSELFLLFTEHREDSYLANMQIILHGLFEEDSAFTYVFIKGPVDVELAVQELPEWTMTLTEKGDYLFHDAESGRTEINPEFQLYYMERLGDVSIIAVPHDFAVRLQWKAVSAGNVEVRRAQCGIRASSLYPGSASGPMKVSAGETGIAFQPEENAPLSEGFRRADWHASDLTEFLGISRPIFSWRVMASLTFLLIGLIVFLIIRLACLFLPNRGKNGTAFWILLAVFCAASVEAEGAYWVLADQPLIRFLWKAVAGAAVLAVWFLAHGKKAGWGGLLPGVAAAAAGDLVMTIAPVPGIALLMLSHILLILCFRRQKRMSRAQWFQWAGLSAIAVVPVLLRLVPEHGAAGWAAAVCLPVLLLTAYSVSEQNSSIRHAIRLFLISGLLLGVYLLIWNEPLAHILSAVLFASSMMLLSMGRLRLKEQKSSDALPSGK